MLSAEHTGRIEAKDLTVGWTGREVARLDRLDVNAGEVLVLAGPNGVGKSTTLKTLARQITPVSGELNINGKDIGSFTPQAFAREVSYVPQILDPPHEMLVEDMVALGRNPHQIWWSWSTRQSDTEAISSALKQTETEQLRKKLVRELSGGERQRVAVAMAVAQETNFMLLDEPTAHLDFKHQLHLVALLHRLKGTGLGIVIVLHDLNLIARLADRVILLEAVPEKPARIAAAGAPLEVLTSDVLRQVYEVDVAIAPEPGTGKPIFMPTQPL